MKHLAMVMGMLALAAATARAQQDTMRGTSIGSYSARGEEGWLGMGIVCSQCSLQSFSRSRLPGLTASSGVGRRWSFQQAPVVFSVEADGPADKAGLHTGDTLVSIDGYPLTSYQGGVLFASVAPGQAAVIRYRRDGAEAETRVVAGERVPSAELAMQDSLRAMARLQARQQEQVQREMMRARMAQQRAMEQSQSALERQREYMQRALDQLQQVEGQFTDSSRRQAVQRTQAMLDSAVARWRVAESLYAQVPTPTSPVAVAPAAPWPTVVAVTPAVPYAPMAPVAPLTYAEHRAFGQLRYTGQLGDVVIEARSPWASTATQVSDSEVVVTSRDLSVRIAIRPRQPTPRAAPAPKAAPGPRPERTPRPPKPMREQI